MKRPSLATRLTLISHAATEAQRRAAFPLDEPLPAQELARVAGMGWSSPRAQRILSGPEQRVQQTAEALGLSPIAAVDLRDCDYGSWSGLTLSEVESRQPEEVLAWFTDPGAAPHGGESILQLIDRIAGWMDAQCGAGHTVAITHSAVIRSALIYALEMGASAFWRVDIPPLSLTDLRFNGRVWTMRCAGCALQR